VNYEPFRRHSDSLKLWLCLVAGSLLFHLIAWATVRIFWVTPIVQADSSAIAVEFLEPVGEDDGAFSSQSVLPQSQAQLSRPVEDDAMQITLSTPAIALAQRVTETSAPMQTSKAPIQTVSPKKAVSSKKIGASAVVDPLNLNSRPKRPAEIAASTADNSAIKNLAPANSVTSTTRLPDVPTVPNPINSQENSNGAIASVVIPTPTPAKFMAQLRAIGSTSNLSNSSIESTISAQLLGESPKSFSSDPSGCVLTPKAFRSFGETVTLKLFLDETGAFNSQKWVTVERSSGNIDYDKLAICVTKTSRFIPAYSLEGDTKRAVSSDIEIEVTLIQ